MNLQDTVKALEAKNITVAINLGVHNFCELDSNCPIAIQLRRLVADSGITLDELLEGYNAITAPDPISYEIPHFNAELNMTIGGKEIAVNMEDVLSHDLKDRVRRKLTDLDRVKQNVKDLGVSLYASYRREIMRQRDTRTIPQLSFSVNDLIEANCFFTCHNRNYVFVFSFVYNPQYIVTDGFRYKLQDGDIRAIRRKAHLEITVTPDNKILVPRVLDEDGGKLVHYHGSNYDDCWGNVHLPERWDGRLPSLRNLAHSLIMSLITVNRDSILEGEPNDMPDESDLFDRSIKLGREGEFVVEKAPTESADGGWGGTHWGAGRRRRTGGQPHTVAGGGGAYPLTGTTLDEAMMRRYGAVNPDDVGLICNFCGQNLGLHYGNRAEICPRDHR